jgi:hypothetical protein
LHPKLIYCIFFSSKNEENTAITVGEAGRVDQYLNIAAAESVFL